MDLNIDGYIHQNIPHRKQKKVFCHKAITYIYQRLHYCKKNTTTPTKRDRKRNIIWFNPPYSKNVQTNVAKTFLNLIKKHFPVNHNLHPVFNKGNVKVSYCRMPNMGSIINNHNKKILSTTTPHRKTDATAEKKTNAR